MRSLGVKLLQICEMAFGGRSPARGVALGGRSPANARVTCSDFVPRGPGVDWGPTGGRGDKREDAESRLLTIISALNAELVTGEGRRAGSMPCSCALQANSAEKLGGAGDGGDRVASTDGEWGGDVRDVDRPVPSLLREIRRCMSDVFGGGAGELAVECPLNGRIAGSRDAIRGVTGAGRVPIVNDVAEGVTAAALSVAAAVVVD